MLDKMKMYTENLINVDKSEKSLPSNIRILMYV